MKPIEYRFLDRAEFRERKGFLREAEYLYAGAREITSLREQLEAKDRELQRYVDEWEELEAENARLREKVSDKDHAGRPQGQGYDGNDPYVGGLPIRTVAAASDLRRRAEEMVERLAVSTVLLGHGEDLRKGAINLIRELAGLEGKD